MDGERKGVWRIALSQGWCRNTMNPFVLVPVQSPGSRDARGASPRASCVLCHEEAMFLYPPCKHCAIFKLGVKNKGMTFKRKTRGERRATRR